MTDDSEEGGPPKPVRTPRGKARRKAAAPKAVDAFDLWLDRRLNIMFGAVANEPIPPELLAMIEKNRKES